MGNRRRRRGRQHEPGSQETPDGWCARRPIPALKASTRHPRRPKSPRHAKGGGLQRQGSTDIRLDSRHLPSYHPHVSPLHPDTYDTRLHKRPLQSLLPREDGSRTPPAALPSSEAAARSTPSTGTTGGTCFGSATISRSRCLQTRGPCISSSRSRTPLCRTRVPSYAGPCLG